MTKCPKCGKDLLLIELFDRIIRGVCPVFGLDIFNNGEIYLDYGEEDEENSIIRGIIGYKCDECRTVLFKTEEEVIEFIKANPDYQKED